MLSALASSPVGFKSFLLSLWNTYQRQRCQTLTKLSVCSCVLMCMCRLLFYNYRLTPHSCVCHLIETSPFPVITSSASSSSPALLSPHRLLGTKRTSLLVHTRRGGGCVRALELSHNAVQLVLGCKTPLPLFSFPTHLPSLAVELRVGIIKRKGLFTCECGDVGVCVSQYDDLWPHYSTC